MYIFRTYTVKILTHVTIVATLITVILIQEDILQELTVNLVTLVTIVATLQAVI